MEKAGLYIHIPFCAYKCPYCDFYSGRYEESAAEKYVERAAAEFEKWRGAEFDTVYLGGGTPSILPARLIARLLEAAGKSFCISGGSEITIECNPSKDLRADIREYAAMGINRVSLGMQSAVDEERRALGRRAGAAQVDRDPRSKLNPLEKTKAHTRYPCLSASACAHSSQRPKSR